MLFSLMVIDLGTNLLFLEWSHQCQIGQFSFSFYMISLNSVHQILFRISMGAYSSILKAQDNILCVSPLLLRQAPNDPITLPLNIPTSRRFTVFDFALKTCQTSSVGEMIPQQTAGGTKDRGGNVSLLHGLASRQRYWPTAPYSAVFKWENSGTVHVTGNSVTELPK